jgi:hypothetical protein
MIKMIDPLGDRLISSLAWKPGERVFKKSVEGKWVKTWHPMTTLGYLYLSSHSLSTT